MSRAPSGLPCGVRLALGRRRLVGVLSAVFILVAGACGSGDDGSADQRTRAERTAEAGARTIPGPNEPLPAGEYATSLFTPGLTFAVVGEGWRVRYPELPDVFDIGQAASGIGFLNVRTVFDPSRAAEEVEKSAPQDMVAWIRQHPNLDADEPSPVTVGGVSGTRLDVGVSSAPKDYPKHCSLPCVPLFQLSDQVSFWMGEGERYRVIVLEGVTGETVTIAIGGPAEEFETFFPKAQEVLDSVEWKEAS